MTDNIGELSILIGCGLIILEVVFLGLFTVILGLVGVALIVTGIAMWAGILPNNIAWALSCCAILSGFLAVMLWKPLLKLQNRKQQCKRKTVVNDYIGHDFFCEEGVTVEKELIYHFSGVNWQLKSETLIPEKTRVEIVRVDVGILWVKMVSK